MKTVLVTILVKSETAEKGSVTEGFQFQGDELTSPESQAIIFLSEQQKDALDGQV